MVQALQTALAVLDGYQTQLADWADKPAFDYEAFVTISTWVQTGFEVFLIRQQLRAVAQPNPPAELSKHFTKETYSRATAYSISKLRYNLIKTVFDQTFQYYLIKYHIYAAAWEFTGGWMDSIGLSQSRTITHSLMWIVALTGISALPSLPWSYYYHFVLEEKYGFNKQTVRLWAMDQIKGYALGAIIGLPILAGFLKVIEWAGKGFVPFLMLFMLVIQLTLQIIYPTFIQPLFNKLTPLPEGDLRSRVNKLSAKLGFPLKHLYVIDGSKRSSHSNAYFYGLPWSKHIVIYDTLIEQSTPSEVEAVLGHELGHWYFSHPTKLLGIAQLHLLFTFTSFSLFIHNKSLFSSFHFDPRLAVSSPHGGPQPIMIGFMLYQLIFGPLDSVAQVFMHAQTRKYEYQADEFSVRLGQKEDLKAGLIKLHVKNLSAPHNDKLYSMYHHSHPTLPERLKAMEEYKETKPLKFKSDRKDL